MLLRFHSRAPGRLFAEMQELADLVAKLGQGANLLLRDTHPRIYRNTMLWTRAIARISCGRSLL
jgi:hypothetical protein